MKVKIKEHSFFARVAAYNLKADRVALVLGQTIHLWNVSRVDFLRSASWVRHEIAHIRQFKRYGFFHFSLLYVLESLRNGYYNNRYEKEARDAELNKEDTGWIRFV